MHVMRKKYSRRAFLFKNMIGSAALWGSGWLLTSFKATQDGTKALVQETPNKGDNPCDDLTGVTPSEVEKRKKFAYGTTSPIPDSRCGNCKLFLPAGAGKACGGCLLFKGPVRETGYCTYWAPIE